MTENEKSLGQLLSDLWNNQPFPMTLPAWEFIAHQIAKEVIRQWQESDEGKAWRKEAVSEWLASLRLVDEGLLTAFWAALRASGYGYRDHITDNHAAWCIAAVCEVLRQRGWIDTAALPPGDEGMAIAGRAACHAVDSLKCELPWNMMSDVGRESECAYVAAVLEVHRMRLVEKTFGNIADLHEGLLQIGWLSPDEAEKLRAEIDMLRCPACHIDPSLLEVTISGIDSDVIAAKDAEIERLKAELKKSRADRMAEAIQRDFIPMSELSLDNQRLRRTMRNAARKLRRACGDEPIGD